MCSVHLQLLQVHLTFLTGGDVPPVRVEDSGASPSLFFGSTYDARTVRLSVGGTFTPFRDCTRHRLDL